MMNEENKITESKEQEIDLIGILLKFIRLIKKRIPLLIASITIFGAIGIFIHYTSPAVYSTTMMARHNFFGSVEVESLVHLLNELIIDKNYEEFGEKTNMLPGTVKKIAEIKSSNIRLLDKKYTDPNKSGDSLFIIKANITDNDIRDSLQTGLIYYFENNPYVKEKIVEYKKNFETSVKFTRQYETILDSISRRFGEILKSKDAVNLRIDPAGYYATILQLQELEYRRREQLKKKFTVIQVIEDFTKTEKPIGLGLRFTLPAFLSAGFIFWLILSGVLELWILIRKLEKSREN